MWPVNTVPSLSSLHLSQGLPSKKPRVTSPGSHHSSRELPHLQNSLCPRLCAIWLPGRQVFRAPESSGHAPGAVKSPIGKPLGQHHGQLHAWGRPSLLGWGPPKRE